MDWFLGRNFFTYGLEVINSNQIEPNPCEDPIIKMFPRMAMCTLQNYGYLGDESLTKK